MNYLNKIKLIKKLYLRKVIFLLFLIFPNLIIFSKSSAGIQSIFPDNYIIDSLAKPSKSTSYYVCPKGRASAQLYWRDVMFLGYPFGNKNSLWNNPNKRRNFEDLVIIDASLLALNDLTTVNTSEEIEVVMDELLKTNYSPQGKYVLQRSAVLVNSNGNEDGIKMKLKNSLGDSIEIEFDDYNGYWLLKDKNNNYYSSSSNEIYGSKNYGSIYPNKILTGVRCMIRNSDNKEFLYERTIYQLQVAGKNSYGEWIDTPDTKIFFILESGVPTFQLNKGNQPSF